jgi:general secretion pathway protein K
MPSCTSKRRAASFRAHERGIALISVLWLIALLGVLALGLMALARSDRLNAHADVDEAAAEGWADAGVFLTLHKLCDIHLARDVPIDGQVTVQDIGGQRIDIATQDEFGKIDLNFAPKEILKGLLQSAGLSSDDSSQLADAIDDRRMSALRRVSDERETDPSSPIPSADLFPFHSVEELKSVPGITEDVPAPPAGADRLFATGRRSNGDGATRSPAGAAGHGRAKNAIAHLG